MVKIYEIRPDHGNGEMKEWVVKKSSAFDIGISNSLIDSASTQISAEMPGKMNALFEAMGVPVLLKEIGINRVQDAKVPTLESKISIGLTRDVTNLEELLGDIPAKKLVLTGVKAFLAIARKAGISTTVTLASNEASNLGVDIGLKVPMGDQLYGLAKLAINDRMSKLIPNLTELPKDLNSYINEVVFAIGQRGIAVFNEHQRLGVEKIHLTDKGIEVKMTNSFDIKDGWEGIFDVSEGHDLNVNILEADLFVEDTECEYGVAFNPSSMKDLPTTYLSLDDEELPIDDEKLANLNKWNQFSTGDKETILNRKAKLTREAVFDKLKEVIRGDIDFLVELVDKPEIIKLVTQIFVDMINSGLNGRVVSRVSKKTDGNLLVKTKDIEG